MDHQEILDKISKGAQNAGEFIAEKAILAKDYTVLSAEITTLRSRINSLYKAIGKATYAAHANQLESAEIGQQLTQLDTMHQTLRQKFQEREALRNR